MVTEHFVRLDRAGPVAVVTLGRPERLNAMGDAMDAQFWDVLTEISESLDVRCVLWRAEGRAFSAGRDLNELGQNRPDGLSDYQFISRGHAFTNELLLRSRVPIVVAIQGWCIGGTFERTLLCDLRIAADDARFRLPELSHGLITDSGGTARLFQMCGHGVAADLVMTGRVMEADEARSYGVVSRVVPRDTLDDEGMQIAQSIAKLPPLAVRLHRQILASLGTPTVAASIAEELLSQMLIYGSSDFAEFRTARAEEREPVYRET